MFYAMNRFDIPLEHCTAFENRWLERDSRLHEFEGFIEFNLLKGPEADGERLYVSHTIWRSEADFQAWLKSPRFKEAHQRPKPAEAASVTPRMISRNKFEALTSVQRITNEVEA